MAMKGRNKTEHQLQMLNRSARQPPSRIPMPSRRSREDSQPLLRKMGIRAGRALDLTVHLPIKALSQIEIAPRPNSVNATPAIRNSQVSAMMISCGTKG
jgi:hypothetical protein